MGNVSKNGISKINIATILRQVYEQALKNSAEDAFKATYDKVCYIVKEELGIAGKAGKLTDAADT